MARKDVSTQWDRVNRNAINDNFEELYNVRKMAIDKAISDIQEDVTNEVVKTSKLNWKNPVDAYEDLSPNADLYDTVMVRDTGKVYRNGEDGWYEIQEIDVGPVNEVDTRLSSQLAENTNKFSSLENANAEDKLHFLNYLGNDENIHPKVISFKNKWNGYYYWMAYTPYPKGATDAENPCIACSNDLLNWTIPNGLINPLEPTPDVEGGSAYNSDTHLVYNPDTELLECWWRLVNRVNDDIIIYRRTSKNGAEWGDKEPVWISKSTVQDLLSPAIIYDNGVYKVWGISANNIKYMESTDLKNWTDLETRRPYISWSDLGLKPWHMDCIETDYGYEMVVQAYDAENGNNNTSDLYYIKSTDNTYDSYSLPVKIIARSKNPESFDHAGIYRSSVLLENGIYYVFYTTISTNTNRGLALSYGSDIKALNGYKNVTSGKRVGYLYFNDSSDAAFKGLPIKKGMIRFNSDTNTHQGYDGHAWYDLYDRRRITSIKAPETLNDYDLTDVSVLKMVGTGDITIKSFSGGFYGQEISIVLGSNTANVTIEDSSRIATPGRSGVDLTYDKVGVKAVKTSNSTDVWSVF